MNSKRRFKLRKVESLLNDAAGILEDVYSEEVDCLSNIPENLQGGQLYERIEESADILGEASDCISESIDKICSLLY